MKIHEPVLMKEVVEKIVIQSNGLFFDGTLGFGGHAEAILSKLKGESIYVGTDKDTKAFEYCSNKFRDDDRFRPFKASYTNISDISRLLQIDEYDAIFADLGVSSFQLDDASTGFTFRKDAKLDLRMNKDAGISAEKVVNKFEKDELVEIISTYGEEKFTKRIVNSILKYRESKSITRTTELKEIIENSVPYNSKLKSVTRVFQALRIYVNNELDELKLFLDNSISLLKKGGRIGVISFHSLEDRIVKEFFKYENLECICPPQLPVCNCNKERRLNLVTRKPIIPSEDEIKRNKRSRSAKFRVAERT